MVHAGSGMYGTEREACAVMRSLAGFLDGIARHFGIGSCWSAAARRSATAVCWQRGSTTGFGVCRHGVSEF